MEEEAFSGSFDSSLVAFAPTDSLKMTERNIFYQTETLRMRRPQAHLSNPVCRERAFSERKTAGAAPEYSCPSFPPHNRKQSGAAARFAFSPGSLPAAPAET